jgi:hypothetical protein
VDKNIAAILREDAKTISIQFLTNTGGVSMASYTYITHLDVVIGNYVVVPAGENDCWKVAVVEAVHDDLNIEPNSDIKYKWVVSVIDVNAFLENQDRNEKIEKILAASYRTNARAAYANQFLAGADPKVLELVKGKNA